MFGTTEKFSSFKTVNMSHVALGSLGRDTCLKIKLMVKKKIIINEMRFLSAHMRAMVFNWTHFCSPTQQHLSVCGDVQVSGRCMWRGCDWRLVGRGQGCR